MPTTCTTSIKETAITNNRSIHTQISKVINDIPIASEGSENEEQGRSGGPIEIVPFLAPSQPHPCERSMIRMAFLRPEDHHSQRQQVECVD